MAEATITQALNRSEPPTAKQFRANLKEIFDSETTFGSARAARLDLLESALDIIQEYLKHGCRIVYLHGKLKEAGYTGSRKELCEWLIAKGLREKREACGKRKEEIHDSKPTENVTPAEEEVEKNESENAQSGDSASEDKEEDVGSENQTVEYLEHTPSLEGNTQKEESDSPPSNKSAPDANEIEPVPNSQTAPGTGRPNPLSPTLRQLPIHLLN